MPMRLMWPISPLRLPRLRPTANHTEANEADEAIVADEIEANVIDKIDAADEIIVIDKPAKAGEADANEANEAEADEANAEADVADELTGE